VPASAAAQQLFRGFSFVAPTVEAGDDQKPGSSDEALKKAQNAATQRDYSGTALLTNRVRALLAVKSAMREAPVMRCDRCTACSRKNSQNPVWGRGLGQKFILHEFIRETLSSREVTVLCGSFIMFFFGHRPI